MGKTHRRNPRGDDRWLRKGGPHAGPARGKGKYKARLYEEIEEGLKVEEKEELAVLSGKEKLSSGD